ncbi:ribosome recycling factor [Flammeovirgaceae bacterium SG7u.111]|nr:ribosome recycling factor [Flammeovirgaceae bacterium SG7u.132]WPO38083.1 ribosome recycling factor [Flammeovirgaceae bacterium SG7u.111]
MEEIELYLEDAKEHMEKAIAHLMTELSKIRAGKAMPSMLDGLMVDYYGSPTPIAQVASINTPDARSLVIKPWEKNMLVEIEKAIQNSDLGLSPQNDGEIIRLNIPVLTEERRLGLVKQAKGEAEHGRISIRNIRKDANDSLKKLLKDGGASEDEIKGAEGQVQDLTDKYVKQVDEIVGDKEADIMKV